MKTQKQLIGDFAYAMGVNDGIHTERQRIYYALLKELKEAGWSDFNMASLMSAIEIYWDTYPEKRKETNE